MPNSKTPPPSMSPADVAAHAAASHVRAAAGDDDIIWPHAPARRPLTSYKRDDVRRTIAGLRNQ